MKTQLYVGQSQLRGALSKYAARFNMLEVRAEPGRVPRGALLRRWTEEVNREFVFSVMFSQRAADLGNVGESELKFGLEVANALGAKWLVLKTAPTIGPSQRSRERLKSLFERMANGERRIAWEPHGVWQEEEAMEWARQLGVHLVHDVTRGDTVESDTLYVRVPGLGVSARLSSGALEKAAESIVNAREAFVVLGADGAARAAQTLRALVRDTEELPETDRGEGPYVFDEETDEDDSEAEDDELDESEEGESDDYWDDEADDEEEEGDEDEEGDEELGGKKGREP